MKKVLTLPSLIFNSLFILIFAACAVNFNKKADICSNLDSDMFVPKNNLAKSLTEDNPHPMVLPKNSNFEKESHPMVITDCSKSEDR